MVLEERALDWESHQAFHTKTTVGSISSQKADSDVVFTFGKPRCIYVKKTKFLPD